MKIYTIENNHESRYCDRGAVSFSKYRFNVLLILLALTGYPLVAAFSDLLGLEATSVPSIVFRIFVATLGIIIFFKNKIYINLRNNIFYFAWVGFWFCYLFRVFYDGVILESNILPLGAFEYVIYVFCFCIFPTFGVLSPIPLRFSQKILCIANGWMTVTLLAVLLAAYLHVNDEVDFFVARLQIERLNAISIGMISGSLLLLGIFRLQNRKSHSLLSDILNIFVICLAFFTLVLSGSKGPIFALLITIFIYEFFYLNTPKFLFLSISIAVVGIFLICFQSIITGNFNITLFSRIFDLASGENMDMSTVYRLQGYSAAWSQFLDSPIFGDSLVERSLNFYPHNLFLEIAVSTGVIGLTFFIILFSLNLNGAIKALSSHSPFSWVNLLFIQYLLGAMFSGGLYMASEMWIFLASSFFICQKSGRVYK